MTVHDFEGQFLHANLFEMASAYLFHLVKNHPFIDANKRTGAVAALVFLELNGVEIDASEAELEELVLEVAQGRREKPSISQFFKDHANETTTPGDGPSALGPNAARDNES